MAATGNMSLILEMSMLMGHDFRAAFNVQAKSGAPPRTRGCGLSVYGPTMNIIRDPRLGKDKRQKSGKTERELENRTIKEEREEKKKEKMNVGEGEGERRKERDIYI
jgi:hypothetical protein